MLQPRLLILLISSLLSGHAVAAQVTKVNKKNRTVIINEGRADGLSKGDRVCFLRGSKKVGCGKVYRLKSHRAQVKVSKKIARRVRRGMEAQTGGSKVEAGIPNVKLGIVLAPMMPFKYQKLIYVIPASTEVESLWDPALTGSAAMEVPGVGAEVEFSVGGYSLAIGARSRGFKPFISTADFSTDKELASQYVETTLNISSVGGWSTFFFNPWNLGGVAAKPGLGLDMDMSTIDIKVRHTDDTDTSIDNLWVTGTSKTTVISAFGALDLTMFFDPVGITIGSKFMVPVMTMGSSFEAVFEEAYPKSSLAGGGTDEVALEDLQISLGHGKNSFGVELFISGFFGF